MNARRKPMRSMQLLLPSIIAAVLTACPSGSPQLDTITPNIGNQGTDVQVTLYGDNFLVPEGSTYIYIDGAIGGTICDNSFASGVGIAVGSSINVGPDFIDLTLQIDDCATLGAHTIAVRPDLGAEVSNTQNFFVICAGCPLPPHLLTLVTQPENTPLTPGGPPVTFRFTGTNFFNVNAQVQISGLGITFPPGPPVVQQSGGLDYFDLPITANASTTPGLHDVTVTTAGGTSNVSNLTVDASVPPPVPPPGGPPNLRSITPTHVRKCGEYVNIKLEGSGFGTFPQVLIDNPNIQGIGSYSTYQADPDQVLVATVLIPDNIPDTSVEVRVQNTDTGAISDFQILSLDPMLPGTPLAGVQYGGSIYQGGGEQDVTIVGQNLQGTTYESFSGIPGLTFSSVYDQYGDGTVIHARVRANGTPLPPVTGDEATNLTITTFRGQSNLFRFRILRPQ